ncbi:MAG: chromate transporter, partial [Ulvibacter sp.]
MSDKNSLKEIAKLFLKLGIIGFGGPAAHIAMMRQEVVVKKQWLSEQHFLDLIGATSLIPGPNSTEMAIHIGREKGGWKGLLIAGICFIMPAVLITGIFAYFYKRYGQQPEAQVFLYGIKPAIIAIILAAIYPLAKKSIKTTQLGIIAIGALALSLLKYNEIYILFGAGFLALLYSKFKSGQTYSLIPLTVVQV